MEEIESILGAHLNDVAPEVSLPETKSFITELIEKVQVVKRADRLCDIETSDP